MISSANRKTLDNGAELCHTICIPEANAFGIHNGGALTKLKDTTFILGDKPMRALLWCNTQKRAKSNKQAKLNGIVVTNTIEVFHETLYVWCDWARNNLLVGEHEVGRVIARPFKGEAPIFERISHKRPKPTFIRMHAQQNCLDGGASGNVQMRVIWRF